MKALHGWSYKGVCIPHKKLLLRFTCQKNYRLFKTYNLRYTITFIYSQYLHDHPFVVEIETYKRTRFILHKLRIGYSRIYFIVSWQTKQLFKHYGSLATPDVLMSKSFKYKSHVLYRCFSCYIYYLETTLTRWTKTYNTCCDAI